MEYPWHGYSELTFERTYRASLTLVLGTFFTVLGVMMASLSTRYYQVLLSHGVVASLGIGLTFMPIIGLPNQWFNKRRGLAVGLAIGGSSVGGVIWPVMVDQLVNKDNISYAWTMRAIGFTQVHGRQRLSVVLDY